MSLIAWYPLNGNINSQGTLGPIDAVNTSSYEYVDGKIGKGLSTGSIYWDGKTAEKILKRNQLTICMWVKTTIKDTSTSQSVGNPLFGNDYMSNIDYGGRVFSMFRFPTLNDFHWSWQIDSNVESGRVVVTSGIIKNIFPENKWTHIAIVYDNPNAYLYVDGEYYKQLCNNYDINKCTIPFTRNMCMITSKDNRVLNDYRFYDKALSAAEVKEIAKGLMLHYSFENPYAEETTNISHSLQLVSASGSTTSGTDSIGEYFTKTSTSGWDGIQIKRVSVKSGRYYTWSMDVMPIKDIEYVIDGNCTCNNSGHSGGNDTEHFEILRGYSHGYISTKGKGKLEAYKWTKIYFTVRIKKDCSNPTIFHTFCPYIPSGDTEVKVYYKNSQLEEKHYDTPYTSSSREAGLIRDNSGMGNDGTQVYQREEIPIINNSVGKVFTKSDFQGIRNEYLSIGYINHNTRYHYIGSTICYEFDITLSGITKTSDSAYAHNGGYTEKTDGTIYWDKTGGTSPVQMTNYTNRLNSFKDGTYHICIEKTIQNQESLNNAKLHRFDLVFGYITGTVTVSNLHAYYQNLDTSTLSLSDKSAIGTHSAYFNGKNFIDCGLVVPEEMNELTLSCWVYKEDWSTLNPDCSTTKIIPSFVGNTDAGGFGLKVEKGNNVVNWVTYYKGKGYGPDNLIDCSEFTSGWHLFTGVSTKTQKLLYVDGKLINSNDITWNAPILSKDTVENRRVNIYVGTEVNGDYFTNLENAYIDDVRIYSTALSSEDIKALYNVKVKIDNKSNLYCNQLVETKSENIASDLSEITECGQFKCSCNINYDTSNKILTFTLTSILTESYSGPYILNKHYGGKLITNKTYRYSIYVKFPRSGRWKVGEERIINKSSSPFYNEQKYEAGKWYKIENEGVATAAQVNFIFYCSGLLETGDKIEIRDFQMYRLYDENYNPGPNIKGQYKTFELNETFNEDVENSGATIVDKYGAEWLEVFYHNTNNNTVWFTDEQEALHTNSQYKFSILDQLENFRGADNKFEFLLEYPQDLPGQYNRWKQTDNPALVQELFSSTPSPASGYEAIHVDWTSNVWGGLLKSQKASTTPSIRTFIDGSVNHNNWYYSIGCYNNRVNDWENAMPGPNNTQSTGMKEVNLYVRIDNLPNRNEIFRQYKRQTKTKEIIEI